MFLQKDCDVAELGLEPTSYPDDLSGGLKPIEWRSIIQDSFEQTVYDLYEIIKGEGTIVGLSLGIGKEYKNEFWKCWVVSFTIIFFESS